MQITRVDRHEFNIYLSRGELSLIRSSIVERMSNLRRKAANCTGCGMEAAELRWLLEEIDKTIKDYEKSIKEDGNVL